MYCASPLPCVYGPSILSMHVKALGPPGLQTYAVQPALLLHACLQALRSVASVIQESNVTSPFATRQFPTKDNVSTSKKQSMSQMAMETCPPPGPSARPQTVFGITSRTGRETGPHLEPKWLRRILYIVFIQEIWVQIYGYFWVQSLCLFTRADTVKSESGQV